MYLLNEEFLDREEKTRVRNIAKIKKTCGGRSFGE